MRKIDRPQENAIDVFESCISLVRNINLKTRLTACKELVEHACEEFEEKVASGQLHTILRVELFNGNVSSEELEDIYTLRMAKKNTPGRELYEKIKGSAPYGICPLCSQREATTIDHYLPKSHYPLLSVTPINLIPACKDCNTTKLSIFPTNAFEEPIHPYFDDIENESWLAAEVLQSTPPTLRFFVDPPDYWDDLLKRRLEFHFNELLLNTLYSTLAASELRQINFRLNNLFNIGGADAVRNYLLDAMETRSHDNINSWQAAMYNATANDVWFCNGGFRQTIAI